MRLGLTFCFVCFFFLHLSSQQIGNVRAERDGSSIVVFYDLMKVPPDYLFDVSLYVSIDGKDFEGPLKSVSGEVGNDISGGREKRIIWNVMEERESLISNNVSFKVQARVYDSKVIEMVYVEGGEFIQGSFAEYDEKPLHSVHIENFFISKYEITQRQWKRIMGYNPSFFNYCDECPVENVSWKDVERFIEELNRQTNLNYRFPSEAEWEYAARGGKNSKKYVFSGSDDPDQVAWYLDNNNQHTRKPGLKKPNELGIYDMSGNVMEWTSDWYSKTYYHDAPYKNPEGPNTGSHKVIRGGSWNNSKKQIRVTNRSYSTLGSKYDDLGIRLARDEE
ncbi:MAG TPA: formylglycine-generating enzyme family protein [Flavobacteriales bacterium]|nr:formylglycine-generating enzyme family protein [Flavobacteriales bacterium]